MTRRRRTWGQLLAATAAISLVVSACGSDSNGDGASGDGDAEFIDRGTLVAGAPEHIDPALNNLVEAYQIVNALYDGLTDFDMSDPENPEVVPDVAETVEANDDATVWTFTIRDDERFSDGEQVLPTSFSRAWERATDPELGGYYSYLFELVEGGAEKLAGEADTISGVVADDEAMTLTVTLAEPYANFDAVAGFQTFFPMPTAVEELDDQLEWENGLMVGNGPYMLERPRTDQEIALVRNPEWNGNAISDTTNLDRIVFRVSENTNSAYSSFEAEEAHNATTPPGRIREAMEDYATTVDVAQLGSYHFHFNLADPQVGGDENVLLRQAVSQAIDRDEINEAVAEGTRPIATGITPPGIPGFETGLCDYCSYDAEAARDAFEQWTDAGNELTEPLEIRYIADAGHDDVVQIMVDNLADVGIEARGEARPGETYFDELVEGQCTICWAGWNADYPAYDSFMYSLFHSDALGGTNISAYDDPEFDRLIDEAMSTPDDDEAGDLYRQAEQRVLNDAVVVVPIYWYQGNYVYDPDRVANFEQTPFGLILWERVSLVG